MTFPLFPDMLHESMVSRVRNNANQRKSRLATIKTRKQAQAYCLEVRKKIRACFAPFPKRTPLNPRITGQQKYDGYTLQKILFESRPGYLVSSNLYIPEGDGPFPCVLGTCGHAGLGKAEPAYQAFCQSLAKQGYMVLISDPVSQGERIQYSNPKEGRDWPGLSCVYEHNMMGKAQRLVGDSFGTWRVWDKIRSLDLLLSLPQADTTRVGVTGNSGGGTMASFLTALDPRITMAAPSCYITTFKHNTENSLPADAEQCPPGVLASGLEMGDFLLSYAPRPTLLMGQKYDFFDVRGMEESFEEVQRIYRLLGAKDNIRMFVGPREHGYSIENRQAMYKFFNQHAQIKGSADEKKLRVKPHAPEALQATTDNSTTRDGSRRACEFTAELADRLHQTREDVSASDLKNMLPRLLKLPKRKDLPHYRSLQILAESDKGNKFPCRTMYILETEPNIRIPLVRYFKQYSQEPSILDVPKKLNLFVPHFQSEQELNRKSGTAMGVASQDAWFFEPRGLGETMAKDVSEYDLNHPYGLDFMQAALYDMFNETMLGRRVHDTLACLDLLAAKGTQEVHLHGRGIGAIVAAMAGLLHDSVKQLTLINAPLSYLEMAQAPIQSWTLSCMIPNVLKHLDLPDVYRALAGNKKLLLKSPWTPQWRPYTAANMKKVKSVLNLKGVRIVSK